MLVDGLQCLDGMESFEECAERLRQFAVDQGLPSAQMWVDWGDVVVDSGRFYVNRSHRQDRSQSAEERYRLAVEKDVGIAFEAICTVDHSTCCFVYLPSDQDEAVRLMMPQKGVKLSVAQSPPKAKLVTSPIAWWLLKLRARDYLRWTHS